MPFFNTQISSVVFFYLALYSSISYSQSKPTFDKQQIINEAKLQLDQMASNSGELKTYCTKNNIKGNFVFDLTIEGKGDVVTVFMVSSDVAEISQQNLFKDKLYKLHFSSIKIPKKEKVKFRHTLGF